MKVSNSFTGRKIANNDLARQRKQFGVCSPPWEPIPSHRYCFPAAGGRELSCLAEVRAVQYTSVPVHIPVTHHGSVTRRFNKV